MGERRIGVAVGDTGTRIAVPSSVIDAQGAPADWHRAADEAASRGASLIVVGMPYSLDGTEGPQARAVRAFVNGLRRVCDVPVDTWDERLTTVEAERLLRGGATIATRGSRRKATAGMRAHVDAAAAAVMLQGYLDSRPPGE